MLLQKELSLLGGDGSFLTEDKKRGDRLMNFSIAQVAVKAATYVIDKPYDYIIPLELAEKVQVGCRVLVGFGRGNKKSEAVVLNLCENTNAASVKPILQVLDDEPILDESNIKLALWLREQYFCSFYDVLKVMLPAGMLYNVNLGYKLSKEADLNLAKEYVRDFLSGADIVDFVFKCTGRITKELVEEEISADKVEQVFEILVNKGILIYDNTVMRATGDKTQKMTRLIVSEDEISKYITQRRVSAGQKEVLELLKISECLPVNELKYFTGVSDSVFKTLVKHNLIELCEQEVYRRPEIKINSAKENIVLDEDQKKAFDTLKENIGATSASCALLHGVTGSGKTLVYLKLIEYVISLGKSAMMLVPEIALTPQMVERFSSYFGDEIAILHSALAAGERLDEWKRIRRGVVKVVVGTRSAVFAPLKNIGIIILDEEQEHTYKSGNTPRYHARDVAKFRCVENNALLLLGSATPAVDSMYHAQSGRYSLVTLKNRFNAKALPRVIISDMRESLREGNMGSIGRELEDELRANIDRGEQSILFLNRRGASRYALCDSCGEVPGCPNCSVSLTYHSANKRLMCHHCGYSTDATLKCECGGKMRLVGAGTQKVETELQQLFPGVGVIRMDTDTTFSKSAHQTILNRFRDEKIPVLLGTQMITKGLDFENVTLVGVIAADQGLYVDNYRAAEDTFSLVTQVVGRAGRGDKEGRAVLQTMSPKNTIIELAAHQDYMKFYEEEITLRKARKLPPFKDLISIVVSGEDEDKTLRGCMRILGKISYAKDNYYKNIDMEILGPVAATIARVNNKFRFTIQISTMFDRKIRGFISNLIRDFKIDNRNKELQIIADVNSYEF